MPSDLEGELNVTFLLIDVDYALGQLRRCLAPGYCSTKGQDCVQRAIDGLERVQSSLLELKEE